MSLPQKHQRITGENDMSKSQVEPWLNEDGSFKSHAVQKILSIWLLMRAVIMSRCVNPYSLFSLVGMEEKAPM